jgi:hypothetical protein
VSDPTAWPSPDLEQLAVAAEGIAERLEEPELRAQVFGLAAVIRNLGREQLGGHERAATQAALAAAVAGDDEAAAVAELRRLAALDRAALLPVDWNKVTGG